MAEAPVKEHPRCLACGVKLRTVRDHNLQFPDKKVPGARVAMGDYRRRERYKELLKSVNGPGDGRVDKILDKPSNQTGDGGLPQWGDYGDNVVCGYRCGYTLAIRLLSAMGRDEAMSLMPPEWKDVPEPPKKEKPKYERIATPAGEWKILPLTRVEIAEPPDVTDFGINRRFWAHRRATLAERQAMETAQKALGTGWEGCCKICDTPNQCHSRAACRRTDY